MTPVQLYQYIRFNGNVPNDVAPFSADNILLLTNIAKNNIALAIAKLNPDYFGDVATTDTVADQQEYTKPTDLMLFKRMDISYTDTNVGSYKPARKVTLAELMPEGEDYYAANQPTLDPLVRFDDTGLFTYPRPQTGQTGSAFIRLWYVPQRPDLENLTGYLVDIELLTGIGEQFHELIGDYVVNYIKGKKGELSQLDVQKYNRHILEVSVPGAFRQLSTVKSSLPSDIALQL